MRALPAGVDLTAYRLVQEALGGARDAGHAGRAEVRIAYGDDDVRVDVADDGAPHGRRLLGMRERVAVYGGELATAPVDGRRLARQRAAAAGGGGVNGGCARRIEPRHRSTALLCAAFARARRASTSRRAPPTAVAACSTALGARVLVAAAARCRRRAPLARDPGSGRAR